MPKHILTLEIARQIRDEYKSYTMKQLGEKYGVTLSCISHIIAGRNWKEPEAPPSPSRKFVVKKTPSLSPEAPAVPEPPAPEPETPVTLVSRISKDHKTPPDLTLSPQPIPADFKPILELPSPPKRIWSLSNNTSVGFKGEPFDPFRINYIGLFHKIMMTLSNQQSFAFCMLKLVYTNRKADVIVLSAFHFDNEGRGFFGIAVPISADGSIFIPIQVYCSIAGTFLTPYEMTADFKGIRETFTISI